MSMYLLDVELINCLFLGMIFAVRSSNDSDSPSSVVAASEKVLVPGGHIDDSSSSTDILEVANTVSGDRSSSKDQLEVADILSGDAQVCVCTCCTQM